MTEIPPLPPVPNGAPTPPSPSTAGASKRIAWLVTAMALLFVTSGAAWLVDTGRRTLAPLPTPDALQILAQVQAEVIPAENSPAGYGVAFNAAGYAALLAWNGSLKPLPGWADKYEAIDITLPCCGARHPFRDESQNCGCGHHQALYGVTKFLLKAGYSTEATQGEVDRWKAYMFPKETLKAEMERRALTDSAVKRALDELKEKGEC